MQKPVVLFTKYQIIKLYGLTDYIILADKNFQCIYKCIEAFDENKIQSAKNVKNETNIKLSIY